MCIYIYIVDVYVSCPSLNERGLPPYCTWLPRFSPLFKKNLLRHCSCRTRRTLPVTATGRVYKKNTTAHLSQRSSISAPTLLIERRKRAPHNSLTSSPTTSEVWKGNGAETEPCVISSKVSMVRLVRFIFFYFLFIICSMFQRKRFFAFSLFQIDSSMSRCLPKKFMRTPLSKGRGASKVYT